MTDGYFNYLAVDTTGKSLKLLLLYRDKVYFVSNQSEGSHSQTLIPEIDKLLKGAGCGLQNLDCVGVVTGPGSFTGTRIGIAAVKGLCRPLNIPAVPVNNFMLSAYNECADESGRYRACFDAEIKGGGMIPCAGLYPLYLQNSYAEGKFKFDIDINREASGEFRVTAKDNGRAAAHYLFLETPDFIELTDLEVRREYRRIGLGRLLMQDLKERAAALGKEKIFLEVRAGNERAVKLYEKAGFLAYGVRKGYYPDGEDGVLYQHTVNDVLLAQK